MGYQHYRLLSELFESTSLLAMVTFGLQVFFVSFGILKSLDRLVVVLKRNLKPKEIILIAITILLPSAAISASPQIYISEIAIAIFVILIQMGNIYLAVVSVPSRTLVSFSQGLELIQGGSQRSVNSRLNLNWFVLISAIWVSASSVILNLTVYQSHPHIPDEVVYMYQARMLAQGQLSMPAPPVPEAFSIYLMQFNAGRWYPAPPVGWPAALALGTWLGAPWLVNPLLAGANVLLAYLVVSELYDRRLARMVVLLLCLSPWFIFMAMSFMTHTLTLTCALMAVLGVIRARQTGRAGWAWSAGLALGVCSLIRPLEALILAGLLGLWALGIGGARLPLRAIIGLILSTGLVAALVFPYNLLLTGSWKIFPINQYTDERFGVNSNAYGFGPDRGMGWAIDPFPGHAPVDGLLNANLNIFQINTELFGWSMGSLWPVSVFLVLRKYKTPDLLMMSVIGAIFIAFFFYYFSGGPDFGARYWFLMIVPLVVLSVRGLFELGNRITALSNGDSLAVARVWLAVACLCLMALVNFFPWRAVDKYYHYLNMRPDIRQIAQEIPFGRSLVLVRGVEHPDFASAAVYNPLDFLAAVPIYAWDRSPEVRTAVLRAYSDRPVWIVSGPTQTGGGYQIVEGPLPALELLGQVEAIP